MPTRTQRPASGGSRYCKGGRLKYLLCLCLLVLLSGCAFVLYGRIGPQKAKKIQVVIEGQEADPNIPKGLIGIKLL